MSGRKAYDRDPVKRAAKRAKQRAAGYRGVKKRTPPAVMQHNKGRDVGGRAAKDARYAGGER